MKKIVFTGGGSAGHVTPNLAIIPHLQKRTGIFLISVLIKGSRKRL